MPWYVTIFFKAIAPFIDPVTREKMKFNEPLSRWVPSPQLQKAFGGDVNFVYDHASYWPALNRICAEKRAAYKERWMRAGSMVGEYEEYLRGGDCLSVKGRLAEAETQPTDTRPTATIAADTTGSAAVPTRVERTLSEQSLASPDEKFVDAPETLQDMENLNIRG